MKRGESRLSQVMGSNGYPTVVLLLEAPNQHFATDISLDLVTGSPFGSFEDK